MDFVGSTMVAEDQPRRKQIVVRSPVVPKWPHKLIGQTKP